MQFEMNLKLYLAIKNMTFVKMGEILDIAPTYLSAVSRGKVIPSFKVAKKIEDFTEGMVKVAHRPAKRKKRRISITVYEGEEDLVQLVKRAPNS